MNAENQNSVYSAKVSGKDLPPAQPANQPESSDAHTPGPWLIDGDDIVERTGALRGVYIGVAQDRGGGRLAQTFANCLVTKDEECRANARLIAAAPDMLEALQLAMCVLFLLSDEVGALGHRAGNVPAKVLAAIDKATEAA